MPQLSTNSINREQKSWVPRHKSSWKVSKKPVQIKALHTKSSASSNCWGHQKAAGLMAGEKPRDTPMLTSSSVLLRITLTESAIPNQLRRSSAAASTQGGN